MPNLNESSLMDEIIERDQEITHLKNEIEEYRRGHAGLHNHIQNLHESLLSRDALIIQLLSEEKRRMS